MIKLILPLIALSSYSYGEPLPRGSVLHLDINMKGGHRLLLNDSSVWDVDPEDIEISRLWLSPFPMEITKGGSSLYPYLIINIQSQEKIKAKPSTYSME
jgi:hypothetical protein